MHSSCDRQQTSRVMEFPFGGQFAACPPPGLISSAFHGCEVISALRRSLQRCTTRKNCMRQSTVSECAACSGSDCTAMHNQSAVSQCFQIISNSLGGLWITCRRVDGRHECVMCDRGIPERARQTKLHTHERPYACRSPVRCCATSTCGRRPTRPTTSACSTSRCTAQHGILCTIEHPHKIQHPCRRLWKKSTAETLRPGLHAAPPHACAHSNPSLMHGAAWHESKQFCTFCRSSSATGGSRTTGRSAPSSTSVRTPGGATRGRSSTPRRPAPCITTASASSVRQYVLGTSE